MNNCPICQNKGYVFFAQDGFAKAKQCQCSLYCDICNNFGYTEVYKDGYRFLKKCQCQLLKEKIKKYNNAEIPSRYSEKKVSNFIISTDAQRYLIKNIEIYIKKYEVNNKGYVLYGSNGIGKTHLLIGMLSEMILKHNISGLYIDFPQWIKKYKQLINIRDEQNSAMELIQKLYNVDVLVIDEFGKTRTEFEISLFEDIFNERYNQKKTMLIGTNLEITSNLNGSYMKDFVPNALFSRINDVSAFTVNRMDGDDFRINGEEVSLKF